MQYNCIQYNEIVCVFSTRENFFKKYVKLTAGCKRMQNPKLF